MHECSYELLETFPHSCYMSASEHAKKLKFSSYVHLPSMNQMLQYQYACVILCNVGEVIIFEHGLYISALEYTRMLSSHVLVCIYTIYKYGHA